MMSLKQSQSTLTLDFRTMIFFIEFFLKEGNIHFEWLKIICCNTGIDNFHGTLYRTITDNRQL